MNTSNFWWLQILIVQCSLFSVQFCCHAEPLSENQARFGIITGDVGLLAQGAPQWIVPHEGLPIEPGDHIRTGDDGQVELVMSDNAVWILQPQSDFVAEHMETNEGRFNLSSGTLMGKVDSERAAGTVQRWEFNTAGAVVSIRGTEFGIEFSIKEGARLGVFEGLVDMQPAETAEGLAPAVQIAAGHEALAKRGKPIQTLARFSPVMQRLLSQRRALERRQREIQDTWSPFTPTVRDQLRRKFVAPPPKPAPHRVVPAGRRKITVENGGGSL